MQFLWLELAGLLREVEQNGAGLEHRNRLAAARRVAIDDCGDAIVGGDRQEVGLKLFSLADVYGDDFVGKARLFEKNRYLVAVGRGPIQQVDHEVVPFINISPSPVR